MNRLAITAVLAAVIPVPASAGDNTAVGVGTGIANSTAVSSSRSTAIGGGNASAKGGTSIVNIAGNPAVTSTTVDNTGTSTVKNVPSVFAPGLAAAGLETCLGSVSGGGSFVGTGFSFGSTIPDPGCAARLDARTLWAMGLRKAALARLCLMPDIARSMPEVCLRYVPVSAAGYPPVVVAPAPIGAFASAEPTGRHVPVMLVDGRNQREHLCSDYDAAAQHCVKWAYEPSAVKVTTVHATSKPRPVPTRLKMDPPPADGAKAASVEVQ